jgi:hypothetical protein
MKKIKELIYVIQNKIRNPQWIFRLTKRNAGIIVGGLMMVFLSVYIFRDKIPFFSATGNDPVAYWKFDEGTGSTAYDTVGSNDGTLGTGTSAPTWVTDDQCVSGKCLRFDGTNDYVDMGSDTSLEMNSLDFTISAWIKIPDISTIMSIAAKSSGNTDRYISYIDASGRLQGYINTSGTGVDSTDDGTALDDNKWHYISIVFSRSGNMSRYVDGYIYGTVDSISSVGTGGFNGNFYVGREPANASNYFFKGYIDEPKIYDYARSADQIKADYASRGTTKGVSAQFGDDDLSRKLSSGLIGYWKMDEVGVSGSNWTAIDSSGNNNNGTGAGNASVGSTFPGKFGNTAYFDGNDDFITLNVSKMPSGLNPTYTWSTWVYYRTSAAHQKIFTWGAASTNEGVYISIYSGGTVGIDHFGNDWSTGQAVPQGQWTHLAGTFDGNTTETLYMNGVQVKQRTTVLSFTPGATGAYIGQFFDGTEDMNSPLDEMRIYNRALNPAEIKALYEFAPGPVMYWKFDEGNGTSSVDSSGNSNNATFGAGDSAPSWTIGKFGNALRFDGVNDKLNSMNAVGISGPTPRTMSFWLNVRGASGNTHIIGLGNISNGQQFTVLDSGAQWYFWGYGGAADIDTTTAINLNTWEYHTLIYNGKTVYWYINGQLMTSKTTTLNTADTTLKIGTPQEGAQTHYNGVIDEVKIYNYVRTTSQIIEDMNAGHPAVGTPVGSTVLHLKMDEGYGSTTQDWSPQNNDANLATGSSAPSWTNDGKFGKALTFDGSGDYIALPTIPSIDVATTAMSYTFSSWIKTSYSAQVQTIIRTGNTGGSPTHVPISFRVLSTSGLLRFDIFDGTNNPFVDSIKAVNDGKWHLATAIRNVSTDKLEIYIDGIFDSSVADSTTGTMTAAVPGNIGKYTNGNFPFKGQIDEVKIYPFALTADQVKIDYAGGKTQVMGALSTGLGGTSPSFAGSREYCVPGDSSTCNSPSGEWLLNEGIGTTIYDTSTNGLFGSFGAGTSAPVWVANGKHGSALQFDGVNDYTAINDNDNFDASTTFSVSAWVKSTASVGRILSKHDENITNGWSMGLNVGGTAYWDVTGPSHQAVYSVTPINDGEWHMVTGTLNGTDQRIYIDGRLDASRTWSGTPSTNALPLEFGRILANSVPTDFLQGQIDNVRIYQYVRTPAQIAWEYNRGAPVAYYKFDDCTGTTVSDWGPNANGGYNGLAGKRGASLNFDGVDDYAIIPDSDSIDFAYNQDFSIALWFKRPTGTVEIFDILAEKWGEGAGTGYSYVLRVNEFYYVVAARYDGSANPTVTSTYQITGTDWHHVVFTKAGSVLTLYLDGKYNSKTTDTTTGTVTNSRTLGIGGQPQAGATSLYGGPIDEVKIFNYGLTASQVKNEYTGSAVRFQ